MFIQFMLTGNDSIYPDRPIKLVIPHETASHVRLCALVFAKQMEDALGQIVHVEPAAATTSGWFKTLRAAKNDGYTLLWHSGEFASEADENYISRFEVVDEVVQFCYVLVAGPKLGVDGINELGAAFGHGAKRCRIATNVTRVRIEPLWESLSHTTNGQLLMLSAGNETSCLRLIAEGAADIQIAVATMDNLQHFQSAGLQPLAVTAATRLPELPHVPTMMETKHIDVPLYETCSVLAVKRTSPHLVRHLAAAFARIKQRDELRREFGPMTFIPTSPSAWA